MLRYYYDAWGNHIVCNPDGTENTDPNFIGGNGWMQDFATDTFIRYSSKGFIKDIFHHIGIESIVRIGAPALVLGGISGGLYSRYISGIHNKDGY